MRQFLLGSVLFFFLLSNASASFAQETIVYIVRHAEKDISDPHSKDPGLTKLGIQRANDLDELLAKEHLAAVFSTNLTRTLQTAGPAAHRINKEIIIYDPSETKLLAKKVLTEYKGKNVLIVGHSNTILPLIEAFGGYTSLTQIKDYEYRYLFKLVFNGNKVRTYELTYGN